MLARRLPVEWVIRGVFAAIAAMLGYFSVIASVAVLVAKVDPERAHALSPSNGQITAKLAEKSFSMDFSSAGKSRGTQLSRLALRQDPTALDAVSALAIQAQLGGQAAQARRLFAYSQALSRRQLSTQLWAIEDAVGAGDIQRALLHYDIALRTSRSAPDLLYPVLVRAIGEPRVRVALTETLKPAPVWARSFINYLAINVVNPQATVQFLQEGSRVNLPIENVERVAVVNAVADRGLYEQAWNYYATFRPGTDRRHSRDPDFLLISENPATFDWTLENNGGLVASIQNGDGGGVVSFSAPAGIGGLILRQTQLLPAGTYILEGHSLSIDLPFGNLPYWEMTCRDGRSVGRVDVPNSAQSNGNFEGRIAVPAGCPVQTLSLVVRSTDGIQGVSGQIDRVLLRPI